VSIYEYVRPARRWTRFVHIAERGWRNAEPDYTGVVALTRCGILMCADEEWTAIAREPGGTPLCLHCAEETGLMQHLPGL
jgi:hypothetical protein